MPTNQRARSRRRRTAGYSLIEVLLAIGIFAIGMIAVASIFPVAILLQRETIKQVEAEQFVRNAKALVVARGFEAPTTDWSPIAAASTVAPMPTAAMDDWSLADRSHNALADTANRTIFWVPLCFDNNPSPSDQSWLVYIFVVRSNADTVYDSNDPDSATVAYTVPDPDNVPAVMKAPMDVTAAGLQLNQFITDYDDTTPANDVAGKLKIGDQIVASDGAVYDIETIELGTPSANEGTITVKGAVTGLPTEFWYAAPATTGDSSTFVDLIVLVDGTDGDGNIIKPTP